MVKYRKNWPTYVNQMDKNITVNQLANDGGAEIYHINYKMSGLMGFMVSDRTFYTALWNEDEGDDRTTIDTTEGNEHIVEANKDKTGKNVLGTVHVEYFKIYFDADKVCRMLKMTQAHAGGNLPRGTKLPTSAIVGDTKKEMEGLIDFIVNKMK